ncbi:MAG: aldehyde dehydrogenase [Candidatus Caldarchaeum sp.]|nr:aldehyde dehydrogenase [Candidatus Caldarchaeum sp.]MDW8063377.1 aldehyde dehydrogenase [Candidatus Caldarchaeum sp.]MDW8435277.1 aldehyde dehydrogenase [Candidatus Caldarchaeum sp.]
MVEKGVEKTRELPRYDLFIKGEWTRPASGKYFEVIYPYNLEVVAEVAEAGKEDLDRAVHAARESFENGLWRQMPASERAKLLWRVADLIESEGDRLARLETLCNGKLYREMLGQLKAIPYYFRYFAGWADKIVGDAKYLPDKPNVLNYTLREPYGVVAIVVPWNSPILLTTLSLAPALACGNTVVVKPSKNAPLGVIALAEMFQRAGFPPGVFNVVTGPGFVGEMLVGHPGVDKVCFTGGTDTGVHVAKVASQNLTKFVLELGGKSPQIVFEDCDVDAAVNGVVSGIVAASGQTCVAGSRLLVQEGLYEEFLDRMRNAFAKIKLGDPMDPHTQMGPVATRDQLDKILHYINTAKKEGARLVYGGGRPDDPSLTHGFFVMPTIFADVKPNMTIWREEIFGPVLAATSFSDENEAVKLANSVEFGLAAGIWTRDIYKAHRVAKQVYAGTVWINMYRSLSYASPFGGFKKSGVGRELAAEAIHEFTQSKSVWVELAGQKRDPFVLG